MRSLFLIISIVLFSNLNTWSQQDLSEYPAGTYWVNSPYKLSAETFQDKFTVVVFWDRADPIGYFTVSKLQQWARKYPKMQLVSIIKADFAHPIPLSELTAFVQERDLEFPLGVAGSFEPFYSANEKIRTKVFIYEGADRPSFSSNDNKSLEELMSFIAGKITNTTEMERYGAWQMRTEINPKHYANPLLECPSEVTAATSAGPYFIAENAHHRIAIYNGTGELVSYVGGVESGDKDNNFTGARLGYVSGMDYDEGSGQLYFVDLLSQKVKVADERSELVYTFLGNGEVQSKVIATTDSANIPMSYVSDLAVKNGHLYLLMAAPSQLLKIDLKTRKLVSNSVLEKKLDGAVPARISEGDKSMYIITTDGRIYSLPYEGDIYQPQLVFSPSDWTEVVYDVAEKKDILFVSLPYKQSVGTIKKGKLSILSGTSVGAMVSQGGDRGYINAKEGKGVKFNLPKGLMLGGSKLLVCDQNNHLLRWVDLKTGATSSFVPKYSFEQTITADAIIVGEPIYFESVILGEGENTIQVDWNLDGWELIEGARNELYVDEGIGVYPISVDQKGCSFKLNLDIPEGDVMIEVYLCLRKKENPDLQIIKKAVFHISYSTLPGEDTNQTLDCNMLLLP